MFLYLKPFLIALALVFLFIVLIWYLSAKYNLFGPSVREDRRRIHFGNVSRFGGVALIFAFLSAIFLSGDIVIEKTHLGLIFASLLLLFYGVWDDLKNLKAKYQFAFQALAAMILIGAGVRVDYITNPFGGAVRLDQWQVCSDAGGICFSVLGSLFIFIWLIGMMNVMNWLDGIDGLAAGIGLIGSVILFLLSLNPDVNQPPLGILAAALAGVLIGFLVFNFHPAKVFLGTSGSIFLGFMLGSLAIFSGGKIATALLIMGLPILDALWVIWQRFKSGSSIFQADKRHLHHKLLESGFSQNQIVGLFAFTSGVFAVSALFLQSRGKIVALLLLLVVVILLAKLSLVLSGLMARKSSGET